MLMTTLMYDSAGGHIPAGATDILVYSDGLFAPVGVRLRAEFPAARFHTISVKGEALAAWIDVEPGCVWPPAAAVALYAEWAPLGCAGFYSAESTQPAIKAALPAGVNPEWFDANWTNVPHVDPGDVATQFQGNPTGGYDISETTPAFEGTTPTPSQEDDVTPADIQNIANAVWAELEQKLSPGPPMGEFFGRMVQAAQVAIKETPADVPPSS